MIPLSLAQIAAITGGQLDGEVSTVVTNTVVTNTVVGHQW